MLFVTLLLKPCTKFCQMVSRGIRKVPHKEKAVFHGYFLPAQTNCCSDRGTEVCCGADAFPNVHLSDSGKEHK